MSALTGLSFYALDEASQQEVLSVVASLPDDEVPEKGWPIDGQALITQRVEFAAALKQAKDFVRSLEPVGFQYFSDEEAETYEKELAFAYYIALADCQLAIYDRIPAKIKARAEYLKSIGDLRHKLKHRHENLPPLKQLQEDTPKDKDSPTRYLGYMMIAPYLVEITKVNVLQSSKEQVKKVAGYNNLRLYLVWTTEMVANICSIMSRTLKHASSAVAECILQGVSDFTGAMGWVLYFLRGGIESGLLLQNTVDMKGSCFEWMWPDSLQISDEVRKLNLTLADRWRGQWKEKSCIILNDAAWGIVNFICFFILYGAGSYGYWGNILNATLFLFDLWHMNKILAEAQTDFESDLKRFDEAIDELKAIIREADGNEKLLQESNFGLKKLQKGRKNLIRDWEFQRKSHYLDVAYASSIVIVFSILCAFFLPSMLLGPMSAVMMALAGSALCFTLGIVYEALGTGIQLEQIAATSEAHYEDYCQYLEIFKAADEGDDNKRRLIFLEMYHAIAEVREQKKLRHFQLVKMWTKCLTDMLIPVLFVATFVFMPLTLGASAFALGLAVILFARWQAKKLQPDLHIELDAFPEEAYQEFCEVLRDEKDIQPQALLPIFKDEPLTVPPEADEDLPAPEAG